MKLLSPQLLATAAVACIGAFSAPAAFAQSTFTPGSGTLLNCDVGTSAVDSKACTSGSISTTLTAFGFNAALGTTQTSGFTQGRIGDFNGLGIGAYTGVNETSTNANHAFDNLTGTGCSGGTVQSGGSVALSTWNGGCGGSIEGLFLDFGSTKVNLSQVGIGFNGGNADLSVWAYTGNNLNMATQTASGSTTTTGTTAAAMAGWTLVSNHDYGTGTGLQNTGGSIYSSYFMITTYFGAATATLTAGNDQFKINSFTVNTCSGTLTGGSSGGTGAANNGNGATCGSGGGGGSTPEPGSLALVGAALLGITASRRRLFGRR